MDPMNRPTLSVIIVNYKSSHVLDSCLSAVFASALPAALEMIVVDSDSADAGLPDVLRKFPSARFIQAGCNNGFAYSCNLGVRAAAGEALLLLNPDTVVAPGALQALWDTLGRSGKAGMAGPKILNTDGSLQTRMRPKKMHSLWRLFCELFYLDKAFPFLRPFGSYFGYRFDYNKEQAVDLLCGSCLLVRKAAVDKIGLLDEGFFLYYEDSDWCLRASRAGYGIVYVPSAVIMHHQGKSTDLNPRAATGHFYRSQLHFIRKHRGRAWAALLYGLNLIGFLFRQLVAPFYLLKDGQAGKIRRHFWALCYHADLRNLWKLMGPV